MTTWFTSDTHYGHAKIITLVGRPFAHVDEMDEAMVAAWNARVAPGDTVYHLGDFAFHKPGRAAAIAHRLNGEKHLIWGNHDKPLRKSSEFLAAWASARDLHEIEIEGQRIVLCHFAMRVWNKSHRGAWHLYGHSHGSLPVDRTSLSMDVGVDACPGLAPVSFAEVAAEMATRAYQPVDHHGERYAE